MEISYIYSRDNTGVREFDNLALLECAHEICEAGGESPHCGFAILREDGRIRIIDESESGYDEVVLETDGFEANLRKLKKFSSEVLQPATWRVVACVQETEGLFDFLDPACNAVVSPTADDRYLQEQVRALVSSVVEFIEASDRCFGIPLVHHAWAWGYDEVRVNYSDAHLEININLVDRVMRDVEHNSIILTHESIDNKQKKEV